MTDRLALPRRYRDQLEALLSEHVPGVEVWAYGSRVNGESHDGSDLDLALRGPALEPLDGGFYDLLEAIEKSNIPILVQAHDWAMLPESFHREIERDYVVLQERAKQAPAGGWRTALWGELATLEYGKSLRDYDTPTGLYKVYGTNGPIGWHSEPLCPYASVIIGRKGAYRGVHYSPDPFFVIDTAFYLKSKVELDTRWAYYQLLTQNINGMDSGSAIPSTSREDFYGLSVEVPPLPEQRAIAHVLGTLDDKIELNRRMNETLEAMARALFKSWFVDFDPVRAKMEGRWRRGESLPGLPAHLYDLFPDRLMDSELGEIPDGWEVRALGEVVDVVGGTTPSTKMPEYWEGGTHCWATPKDLSALTSPVLLDTERKITDAGLGQIGSGLLPTGTLLLSSRAPIGYLAVSEEPVAINQGFIAMPPREGTSTLFMLHWCSVFHNEIVNHANGSTFPEISKSNFRRIPMIVPDTLALIAWNDLASALHSRMVTNERESRALVAKRDALLPKLVLGEIRVRDSESLPTEEEP